MVIESEGWQRPYSTLPVPRAVLRIVETDELVTGTQLEQRGIHRQGRWRGREAQGM